MGEIVPLVPRADHRLTVGHLARRDAEEERRIFRRLPSRLLAMIVVVHSHAADRGGIGNHGKELDLGESVVRIAFGCESFRVRKRFAARGEEAAKTSRERGGAPRERNDSGVAADHPDLFHYVENVGNELHGRNHTTETSGVS